MKNISIYFLFLSSLTFSQTEVSSRYDHIGRFNHGIAIVELNGKKGAIDEEGKEVIKTEWENLTGFGCDGVGFARKNGLVGLIKKDGTIILEPKFERIGGFHKGRAIISKGSLKGIIDTTGKVVIEPKYEKLKFEENGLVRATISGKEVLIKVDN